MSKAETKVQKHTVGTDFNVPSDTTGLSALRSEMISHRQMVKIEAAAPLPRATVIRRAATMTTAVSSASSFKLGGSRK